MKWPVFAQISIIFLIFLVPLAVSTTSVLKLQRLFPGQYDNTKYNIIVEDPDGIKELLVKKADGGSMFGGEPPCMTKVDSGTVTLLPSDFPLTGYAIDCKNSTVDISAQMPPLPDSTTTTTTPSLTVSCSATKDGVCPAGCAASSDYDCCVNAGKQWIDGGCFDTAKTTTCPPPPSEISCPEGTIKNKYDASGCLTGYECITKSETGLCPAPPTAISCLAHEQLQKITDSKGCVVDYKCVSVEQHITTEQPAATCPLDDELLSIGNKCIAQDGKVVTFTDPSGCKFIDCRFTDEEILPDPLKGHEKCPSDKEIKNAVKSCKATGLSPAISFEGGCKIAKCVQENIDRCKIPTPEDKLQLENQCDAKGLSTVKDVDPNGCAFYRCGENAQETCAKEVPSEAFKKCQSIGGEMVVQKGDNGCVAYAYCVTRGDERDAYVEQIEEVPEATELLDIALKLEKLKVELIKLSDEAGNIATFYADRGDEDEERFNRVSSMFEAAADRVDGIREEIRSRLDSLTVEDMLEIRRDIKHLKEVTLKDIVYMMLSNSDEVKETIKASNKISVKTAEIEDVEEFGSNCGTDGLCFDRAFRVCKPVAFKPEGSYGPIITVIGLEGNICIVKARLPDDMGPPPGIIPGINPPYEMTCKFEEYSFGVRGPEDFIPHCEGPMAELMKQFGPRGPPGGRGGPGGPGGFSGPGGCKGPSECDKFCRSNIQVCIQWCLDNPGMCPEDKMRGPPPGTEGFGPGGPRHQGPGFGPGGPGGLGPPPGFGGPQPTTPSPSGAQACVGCLNNAVCDIGECSECVDCLR